MDVCGKVACSFLWILLLMSLAPNSPGLPKRALENHQQARIAVRQATGQPRMILLDDGDYAESGLKFNSSHAQSLRSGAANPKGCALCCRSDGGCAVLAWLVCFGFWSLVFIFLLRGRHLL